MSPSSPSSEAPDAAASGGARRGLLDRALSLFSDVRAGEGGVALLMALNLFLLLCAYYIIKTVREPLILAQDSGAELKSYASAVQAGVLLLYLPFYSWFSKRVSRQTLIIGVVAFFGLNVELFYVLSQFRIPLLGFIFYVWVGIFSVSMIAQFWSFANDAYTKDEGDRLFPIIAVGATLGAPVGSKVAELLFERWTDPYQLLHISAVLLALHLGLSLRVLWVRRARIRASAEAEGGQEGGQEVSQGASADDDLEGSGKGGFALIFRSRYLLLIALVMMLLNFVNTTGEYILGKRVAQTAIEEAGAWLEEGEGQARVAEAAPGAAAEDAALALSGEVEVDAATRSALEALEAAAPDEASRAEAFGALAADADDAGAPALASLGPEQRRALRVFAQARGQEAIRSGEIKRYIGGFYGDFFFVVNIVALLLQLFVVSRIVKHLGMGWVVMILPLISLSAYSIIATGASLLLIRVVKTAENATDYSIMNTGKALLWLPTTAEEKYRAKQTTDTFFVRFGDMLSAGLVFVGAEVIGMGIGGFAGVNVGLVGIWIGLTILLIRRHRALIKERGLEGEVAAFKEGA